MTVSKAVALTTAVDLLRETKRVLEVAADVLKMSEHQKVGFEFARAFLDRRCERDALDVVQSLSPAPWAAATADILARLTSRDCLDDAFAWIESAGDHTNFFLLAALGGHDLKLRRWRRMSLLARPVPHMMDRDNRAGDSARSRQSSRSSYAAAS